MKVKDDAFLEGANVVLKRLDQLAEVVEMTLNNEMDELSKMVSPCMPWLNGSLIHFVRSR